MRDEQGILMRSFKISFKIGESKVVIHGEVADLRTHKNFGPPVILYRRPCRTVSCPGLGLNDSWRDEEDQLLG